MTISTRGQGITVEPPDPQNNAVPPAQQPSAIQPGGPSSLSLQLSEPPANNDVEGGPSSTAADLEVKGKQGHDLEAKVKQGHDLEQVTASSCNDINCACQEPDFPHAKLVTLDEKISSTRWVVPVLPDQELEVLINAAIHLCRTGQDVRSEACQRFFREGLTISFTKILTDDAVNSWKNNIHSCILSNCSRLVELCVVKLSQDWFPLLDLLAMVLNPNNKFHTYNAARQSESVPLSSNMADEELYARPPPDARSPRGWLVDLINKFGSLDGFQILLERFQTGKNLTIPVIYALLRPFGLCYELLTVHTVTKYFMPIVEMVPNVLDNLTDDELKKEAKNESKNDAISAIIKACKNLISKLPRQEETIKNLEIFRLKMILRLLQISSFNGKMNALNEVNKVIASVTYYPHNRPHTAAIEPQEEEWLTPERMAKWIKENKVLEIVLRDSLHQPQYVEKLEKILRFIIKERSLSLSDLDAVWAAQAGKHEAIVKNVHDLLAKLAWDFSPEQLDHLFECFQASWTNAPKKQREKLLELIRRLAEDDKDGVMAHKVLTLFWNLAHSEDVLTEIMDQALSAHVKILDYSCSQERDSQKTEWLDRCVEELKSNEMWVLPALKQIREICCLYEPNPNVNHTQRSHQILYRQEMIERLQNQHGLVVLVTNSLTSYMANVRQLARDNPDLDPNTFYPDRRFNHILQVQERLNFLRFLLKDGQLWLCAEQARQIWQCLAEQAVFTSDREACFKWFSKLMGDEPDLDPAINKDFFENNVLQLDPTLLTESGIKCFERFFKAVNLKEGKLKMKKRTILMDHVDLIGTEYIWRVVTNSSDEIASRAIELLKEVSTNLGPRLQSSCVEFHENYISECLDRLRAHYDTITVLKQTNTPQDTQHLNRLQSESVRMCRVMKVLQEYISECDGEFVGERKLLPLHRSSRGKHMGIIVRISYPGRQAEDVEMLTHSNDTIGSIRRQILKRMKTSGPSLKVDLFVNGDLLDPAEDRRLLSQLPIRDKTVISAKMTQGNTNTASSPESSSDSSTSSPQHSYDNPNLEAENSLPGVLMSQTSSYVQFFLQVADRGCELGDAVVRDSARAILKLIPPDTQTINDLHTLFAPPTAPSTAPSSVPTAPPTVDSVFFNVSQSRVLYNLEVMYTLLMPAADPLSDKAFEFQLNFLCSPHAPVILDMLTKNNFLPNADVATKRSAYLMVLKMCKILLSVLGHIMYRLMDETPPPPSQEQPEPPAASLDTDNNPAANPAPGATPNSANPALCNGGIDSVQQQANSPNMQRCPVVVLKQALANLPNSNTEYMLRTVVCKLAQNYTTQVVLTNKKSTRCVMLDAALAWQLPGAETIKAVMQMAWVARAGNLHLLQVTDIIESATANSAAAQHDDILGIGGFNIHTSFTKRQIRVLNWSSEAEVLTNKKSTRCVMLDAALAWQLPGAETIKAVMQMAWVARAGNLHLLQVTDIIESATANSAAAQHDDILVCREALEVLTVSLVLSPNCLESLIREPMWQTFIIDLLLCANNRAVRVAAVEQFLMISTLGCSQYPLQLTIIHLFSVLHTMVVDYARNSHEYFQLLCRLLNFAFIYNCPLPNAETLLNSEIRWLKEIRAKVKKTGETGVEDAVLEGHLGIAKELLSFMSPEKKFQIGACDKTKIFLIKELVEDFILPASRLMLHLQRTGELIGEQAVPVCSQPQTLGSAFDLLATLCVGCVPNMKLLTNMLTDMFYSERDDPLVEWDYLPPVGPRPCKGFVGLKNAGATCYMNSVLQQLYMVEGIRVGLLAADGAATDLNEDFSGEERPDNEVDEKNSLDESRKEYNIGILKQVQAIFGHLAYSKLQYYIPRGLWKHFKLQGEPVNLREQQDAVEFFMSLVESIDEALKALGQEQIMGKILGGSYSDQKICKGCPHRYSKEEPFSVISVDIRNHSTLLDSLEQYVKGELLEGADAYHCDKCNKKVVTVKRLCVKKLPPILAIQLKRFEYDFERVCAIKFNDYFEFPRHLDMAPYTVTGLAKQEGEMVDCEGGVAAGGCTKYQLTGIVVHSGQASGGHYYSYIHHRPSEGPPRWYKFDDGDVSECKMEDDEEMKMQCFGGDYMGEVFDHMLKRMSYRRQKRWWNAYMLYYTRNDVQENNLAKSLNQLSLSDVKQGLMKMPAAIERSVRRQNIRFMHNRNQFSTEYFQFMRRLAACNIPPIGRQHPDKQSPEAEELSMLTVQILSKFLYHTGFHTKKSLRGNATDWFDALNYHIRTFKTVRSWFAHNVLFKHPHRFSEYLLSCPSMEVRSAMMKIIVFLAHYSLQDGPCPPPMVNAPTILLDPKATMSDHLLMAVLSLVHKEVSEHGRHLPHYFTLFHMYSSFGINERTQLIRLNVPATFMLVALDEGPGPPIKYQYPELTKLHLVVSQLIRCCDVTSKTQSSTGGAPLPNPYAEGDQYIVPIQIQAADILYSRSTYVKKVIEDLQLTEEGMKLLQFCCWENPHMSRTVLSELLWQIAFAYCHELRHFMDLLLGTLLMQDSWQSHRIHNAMKGMPDEREGLFDTILRAKNHYQKRAYQCIKCLVSLFTKCRVAFQMLQGNDELKRKWGLAVEWLQDELDRRPYVSSGYSNWSPPAQSNETTNGYFLERSGSARKTLELACELCPDEEPEAEETSEEGEPSQSGEEGGGVREVGGAGQEMDLQHQNDSWKRMKRSVLVDQVDQRRTMILRQQQPPQQAPKPVVTGEEEYSEVFPAGKYQQQQQEQGGSGSGGSKLCAQDETGALINPALYYDYLVGKQQQQQQQGGQQQPQQQQQRQDAEWDVCPPSSTLLRLRTSEQPQPEQQQPAVTVVPKTQPTVVPKTQSTVSLCPVEGVEDEEEVELVTIDPLSPPLPDDPSRPSK
ncbi:LOW QUALITY PROTEIN: probable ubiquitin carboxyl-terminal hydrolase FAF-X [Nilaparvata lugens]|uniref:LOW QUALITY PROTEIN: probable ubiquitin carboxyl-terminal hydrolase FAF-X n=1 Tax=Nilaparvata lugens TaxID=108931 RepID=UPI00193E3F5A|nr:LOW QUALITY PROTEIN: probable ubiquitin carboxyl-terminal hydrolase FAF-X [Nilaparvata lugens]